MEHEVGSVTLMAYSCGVTKGLDQVNNDVFSSKMLGDGIAIVPVVGEVYAPCDASVGSVYNTSHVISLNLAGLDLLIHIGIDTVDLAGEGFEVFVCEGDKVESGQLIARFDLSVLNYYGKDPDVVLVMTNSEDYLLDYKIYNQGKVDLTDKVMELVFK